MTDGIKSLIAYVFAFSFALAGQNVFKALTPYAQGKTLAGPWHYGWINFEILVAFSITASVFYYQGSRHLDLIFTKDVNYRPTPLAFIISVSTIAITMVPFILMAFSLNPDITTTIGFTGFFFSYAALIGLGLVLLVCADLKDLFLKETRAEIAEYFLRIYWMMMNSVILIVLGALFFWAARSTICPTQVREHIPSFLLVFGLVAVSRDALDFFWAWPYLFPSLESPTDPGTKLLWPLRWIGKHPRLSKLIAYITMLLAFSVAWLNHWPNYRDWAAACAQIATPIAPGNNLPFHWWYR